MITVEQITRLVGAEVLGDDGKIGNVDRVLSDPTGQSAWVIVHTGFFESGVAIIPLAEATMEDSTLRVPYDRKLVNAAPPGILGDRPTLADEAEARAYYGLGDTPHRRAALPLLDEDWNSSDLGREHASGEIA